MKNVKIVFTMIMVHVRPNLKKLIVRMKKQNFKNIYYGLLEREIEPV